MLLSSGASGQCTKSAFITVTNKNLSFKDTTLTSMMELLILYSASIDHNNAGVLKHAVSNTRLDLSRTLPRAKNLDRCLASEAFCEIGSRASPNDRLNSLLYS